MKNYDNRGLNIAHLNVNGLRSKLDYLKIVVNKNRFDILCLNETKIDGSIADSDIEQDKIEICTVVGLLYTLLNIWTQGNYVDYLGRITNLSGSN